MSSKRANRYNDEFKKQIVGLVNNDKKISETVTEYDIARFTVNKWLKDFITQDHLKQKITEPTRKKN